MQFILKRDKYAKFFFAPLQSEFTKSNLHHLAAKELDSDTVIYQRGNSFYTKSTAAIEILLDIGGIWKVVSIFKIFPASLLDRMYDFIASNRYRWFGRKKECMVPNAEIKSRFLG